LKRLAALFLLAAGLAALVFWLIAAYHPPAFVA